MALALAFLLAVPQHRQRSDVAYARVEAVSDPAEDWHASRLYVLNYSW